MSSEQLAVGSILQSAIRYVTTSSDKLLLFTIGHSNHELESFMELIRLHGVTAVADVRSDPYSRYTSQFNREVLSPALARHGIQYVFLGEELGARRTEAECYVDGQASYERIAKTPAFGAGLERIRRGVAEHRIALLCAEKDPLTCHRTILVCRRLRDEPFEIAHILEDGSLETMDSAESRLLDEMHLPQRDLFRSREELLDEAYERRGVKIAFTETES